LTQIFDMDNEA